MKQTLEQQRAAHVWQKCQGCPEAYAKLAKGLPALIMNSGLMQVMAFLHEKSKGKTDDHHHLLAQHLREWLCRQFPQALKSDDFYDFMDSLMKAEPRTFQQITTETFHWLRWVRQIAPAIAEKGGQ